MNDADRDRDHDPEWGMATATGSGTGGNDLKEFLLVLRRALLVIVRWVEKKYDLPVK